MAARAAGLAEIEAVGRRLLERAGFRDVELVGVGGYAAVFRARREGYGIVAVRLPRSVLEGETGRAVEWFEREYRVWRTLLHPHIAVVLDYLVLPGGVPAIVVEYLPVSLRRLLDEKGRLPPREAVEIAYKVGKALAYMHSRGLVHGDVKPENILFTSDGEPKLADIGQAAAPAVSPRYAAPEQLRGERPRPETDSYQLALLLCEMLEGPRCLQDPRGTLEKTLRSLRAPADAAATLLRALEEEPRERPGVETLLEALEALLGAQASSAEAPAAQPAAEAMGEPLLYHQWYALRDTGGEKLLLAVELDEDPGVAVTEAILEPCRDSCWPPRSRGPRRGYVYRLRSRPPLVFDTVGAGRVTIDYRNVAALVFAGRPSPGRYRLWLGDGRRYKAVGVVDLSWLPEAPRVWRRTRIRGEEGKPLHKTAMDAFWAMVATLFLFGIMAYAVGIIADALLPGMIAEMVRGVAYAGAVLTALLVFASELSEGLGKHKLRVLVELGSDTPVVAKVHPPRLAEAKARPAAPRLVVLGARNARTRALEYTLVSKKRLCQGKRPAWGMMPPLPLAPPMPPGPPGPPHARTRGGGGGCPEPEVKVELLLGDYPWTLRPSDDPGLYGVQEIPPAQ